MKGTVWEREGGKNLTKLERSVMTMAKKEEKSQTFLINVFNFFLFAEPPGSVTRKGLLEGVIQDHEGVRLEVILSGPSSGPSISPAWMEPWQAAPSLLPAAELFPDRRCWPSVCSTGEHGVQACPGWLRQGRRQRRHQHNVTGR